MNNNDDGTLNIKGFDYDDLVEESLKNVVKKVLKITAETGLCLLYTSPSPRDP